MRQFIAKTLLGFSAVLVGLAPVAFAAESFVNTQQPGGINVPGSELTPNTQGEPGLITSIKKAINLVLTFLGLIALVILLYGGFLMVTAAGDEGKYKKGFTILRQSAIGLIFIGLSALFVNLIFWIIGTIA